MTTIWIVGSGTGAFNPPSSVTATIETWGAGQAGNNTTGAGGIGAGYAKKNSLSLTANTPVAFSLGAPGITDSQIGGDTWFSAAGTVIANGGGSATTRIGDLTYAGGAGGTYGGGGTAGGGGAAGPAGAGAIGGSTGATGGGAGGGASNAGSAGAANSGNNGGAGGNGTGTGGTGGTSGTPSGGLGGKGAGGGGGFGDGTNPSNPGGAGGDDYDHGGGGGGGAGHGSGGPGDGANGGTPGGGGTAPFGASVIIGSGGFGLIKITYAGTDADQILVVGTLTTVQIPATWPPTCRGEAWAGGGNGSASASGSTGAGGGSSGYSRKNSLTITPGGTLTVAVGAQGVDTTIGASVVVARHGSNATTTTGGTAGAAGTGDTATAGQAGGAGVSGTYGGAGGAGVPGFDGAGAVGTAATTNTTGRTGGTADGALVAGGTGVAASNGNPGTSSSRGGSGGGGGSTTSHNGGNGGWPGGGGGGGAGTAGTGGTGATGLVKLSVRFIAIQATATRVAALVRQAGAVRRGNSSTASALTRANTANRSGTSTTVSQAPHGALHTSAIQALVSALASRLCGTGKVAAGTVTLVDTSSNATTLIRRGASSPLATKGSVQITRALSVSVVIADTVTAGKSFLRAVQASASAAGNRVVQALKPASSAITLVDTLRNATTLIRRGTTSPVETVHNQTNKSFASSVVVADTVTSAKYYLRSAQASASAVGNRIVQLARLVLSTTAPVETARNQTNIARSVSVVQQSSRAVMRSKAVSASVVVADTLSFVSGHQRFPQASASALGKRVVQFAKGIASSVIVTETVQNQTITAKQGTTAPQAAKTSLLNRLLNAAGVIVIETVTKQRLLFPQASTAAIGSLSRAIAHLIPWQTTPVESVRNAIAHAVAATAAPASTAIKKLNTARAIVVNVVDTFAGAAIYARSALSSITVADTLGRMVGVVRGATGANTKSLVKQDGLIRSGNAQTATGFTKPASFLRAAPALADPTVTMTKGFTRLITGAAGASSSLTRALSRSLSWTVSVADTLIRQAIALRSGTATQVSTIVKAMPRFPAATSPPAAAMVKAVTPLPKTSATQATGSLVRSVGLVRSLPRSAVGSIARAITTAKAWQAPSVAGLTRSITTARALTVPVSFVMQKVVNPVRTNAVQPLTRLIKAITTSKPWSAQGQATAAKMTSPIPKTTARPATGSLARSTNAVRQAAITVNDTLFKAAILLRTLPLATQVSLIRAIAAKRANAVTVLARRSFSLGRAIRSSVSATALLGKIRQIGGLLLDLIPGPIARALGVFHSFRAMEKLDVPADRRTLSMPRRIRPGL